MVLTPFSASSRAIRAPSSATLAVLSSALCELRITTTPIEQRRNASHQAQGRANGAKDGPGKRLGAKKTAGEYVIPGNILFKQRGTHWFPGDHCFMGRDHTIHAGVPGYVRYYRDPLRHPKRKFIGIVFEKEQNLPQAPHAVRRRKLGMLAYQMPTTTTEHFTGDLTQESPTDMRQQPQQARVKKGKKKPESIQFTLRPGYQYRRANWEIGREAEKKEEEAKKYGRTTRIYPKFKPGDRFAAWRKRTERVKQALERRSVGKKQKARK